MEGLDRLGMVKVFSSSEVVSSSVGIGFEKLDRDAFDPRNAYDPVAATGVKWVRLQSGWAKTERVRGVYDFAWLDEVVDQLVRRGLQPWLCLCYGNGLYTPEAGEAFGGVGYPPVHTEDERRGWHDYVVAVTSRYRGRIQWYEVWNEPENRQCWKPERNGAEYGEFLKDTAKAIREGDPEAKVIGGSHCLFRLYWLTEMLETGAADYMDALSYHGYDADETSGAFNRVEAVTALCRSYNPKLKIIQGETGAQSQRTTSGALWGGAWTQLRQAKFMARHMVSDFFSDILFSSYFSALDMMEALCGKVGDLASYQDFAYFGILAAQFDQEGRGVGTFKPKLSYRTLCTLASIFQGEFERCTLPFLILPQSSLAMMGPECRPYEIIRGGFRKPNGSYALAYWKDTPLMTSTYEGTMTLEVSALPETMRLVDTVTGEVFALPETMVERTGVKTVLLKNIPLLDYPLLLTFGDFVVLE